MKKLLTILLLGIILCSTVFGQLLTDSKPIPGTPLAANQYAERLVALYTFVGPAGNLPDSSHYGNHGTFNGSGWSWSGQGVSFPGAATDYVGLPLSVTKAISIADEATIIIWARPNSTAGDERVMGCFGASGFRQLYIWMDAGGAGPSWATGIDAATGGNIGENSTGTVVTTRLQQVVCTWRDPLLRLYVDGVCITESAGFAGPISNPNSIYRVGAWETAGDFDGDIALASIYDRALSASEIQALYIQQWLMFDITPIWMFFTEPVAGGNKNIFESLIFSSGVFR